MKINPQFFRIRDRVEIRIASGDEVAIFLVRIEDITDDGIYVDRPIIDKRLLDIKPGQRVEVEIKRKVVKYRFTSTILSEARLGAMSVILLEYPDEVKRIRPKLRRKFLRLNIPSRIVFHQKGETARYGGYKRGIIIDVSGGGVKFTAQRKDVIGVTPGVVLFLTFNLSGEISVIEQAAKVLKIEPCARNHYRSEIVCRYSNISPKLMEAIIVHNVRNQRRYRIEKGGSYV
ncbi:MAG TPA: flagellar brake protein [Bacteroidetes bacterium]|nr:flagellar brake protein [Bacteroidota bacterium]